MGYALVGSAGAVSPGSSSVTAAWGSGSSQTAGNLLIAVCTTQGVASTPTISSGWSVAKQAVSTSTSASIFYKIAAGSDSAPTISLSGSQMNAQLCEFSGNAASSPLDQIASATGTGASTTITNGSADVSGGELIITCDAAFYSVGGTKTLSDSYNNGATPTSTTNNGTSTTSHYCYSYGVTTGNSAADSNTYSHTSNNLSKTVGVLASFQASGPTVFPLTLGTGSFVITGSPLTMDFWEIKAAAASFAITGVAASLVVPGSLSVNLDPGSLAITGIGASPHFTRELDPSPGSFSITGSPLSFTFPTQPGWLIPLNPVGESLTPISPKSLSLSPLSSSNKTLTPLSPGSKTLSPQSPGSKTLNPIEPSEH